MRGGRRKGSRGGRGRRDWRKERCRGEIEEGLERGKHKGRGLKKEVKNVIHPTLQHGKASFVRYIIMHLPSFSVVL